MTAATLPERLEPVDVHPDQVELFDPPRMMSAPRVCELAGVSYRQLDYWCRTGLIHPTTPARGSGSQRRFSDGDLAVVRAVKILLPFYDHRHGPGTIGRGVTARDPDLLALLDRVRRGERGMVEVERGIWFDLDVLIPDE